MTVKINTPDATLGKADIEAWNDVPVSIAVDLEPTCQIDPSIRPKTFGSAPLRLLGRAMTVRVSPPDFGGVVHSFDHVEAGDVLVITAGGRTDFAMIGDILGGHLRNIGCAGLVVDGAVRDIGTLGSWIDFPVFARAINPLGPTGAVDGELNGTIDISGCSIASGDLIIGDRDGLVALRPALVSSRIEDAKARLAAEDTWIQSLKSGKTAAEVFDLQPNV